MGNAFLVVEGTAGNGLVKVVMTGGAELVDLQIDKSVVDPEDVDTLQDLVIGAFKEAHAAGNQETVGVKRRCFIKELTHASLSRRDNTLCIVASK